MMNFIHTRVDITPRYDNVSGVSSAHLHNEFPGITVCVDNTDIVDAGPMPEPCMTLAEISVSDDVLLLYLVQCWWSLKK